MKFSWGIILDVVSVNTDFHFGCAVLVLVDAARVDVIKLLLFGVAPPHFNI